ncbi:MAG: inositol monophosphatase family protein [Balneolales bacterium]
MSNELETATLAAESAAQIIRKFSANSHKLNIELKGKNDLVTDADLASEKEIIRIISERFPEDHFLAEESASDAILTNDRTWIIDPIDGTTNFAHDFPIYCVSIGFWENKEAKAAIVLEVNRNEIFTAEKGKGAFLNGKPIRVSQESDPKKALILTGFPYKDLDLLDDYLDLFKSLIQNTHGVRRPGSAAYDLCCIAAGRGQGFYEYGLSAWDIAAGSLIIQEAGGVVSDWENGPDWLFGQRYVAGNKNVHAFLLDEIKEHISTGKISSVKTYQ